MAVSKSTNIANGIISGIVLACGIIMSILIDQLIRKLLQMATLSISSSGISYNAFSYVGTTYWAAGFAYIIPGLIGVIASFTRQKCGFVTQMVFAIITLVVMGIVFIIALIAMSALSVYGYTNCTDVFGTCTCSNGYRANVQLGSSCSEMSALTSMAIGTTAMVIIGWIGCLAASITGGMLACAREDTPGVVIHQTHQPGVTVMHMGNMQPVAQPYVIQPGYGAQPNQYVGSPGYVAQPSYHTGYGGGSNYAPSNPGFDELGQKK